MQIELAIKVLFCIISTLIFVNMHIILCDSKNNNSYLVFLRNFSIITDIIFISKKVQIYSIRLLKSY